MRTTFKKSLLLTSIQTAAVCAATSFLPTTGLAEAAQGEQKALGANHPSMREVATTFDIDFPGGTLQEFVEALKVLDEKLSIMVAAENADAAVPSFSFKKIRFDELSKLIDAATMSSRGNIKFSEVTPGRWLADAFYQFPKNPRELTVAPVESVLRKNSVEDFLAIIEEAFSIAGIEEMPKFHLHKETSVLMASLTPSEKEILNAIIIALETPVPDGAEDFEKKQES